MSRLSSAVLTAPAMFVFAAGSASAATTACSTVAACVMGTNSSSGPGVGGTSSSGFGLSGISKSGHGVNGTSASSFGVVGITTENATSAGTARAGVVGEDSSTNKNIYNSGVSGTSTNGYGVSGQSNNIGVYGFAPASSTFGGGVGVEGVSTNGFGVEGITQSKVSGEQGDTPAGVYGNDESAYPYSAGVYAASNLGKALYASSTGSGYGVYAESKTGTALYAVATGGTVLSININGLYQSDLLLGTGQRCPIAKGALTGTCVTIDSYGNEVLAGTLTQNGTPMMQTQASSGADVISYGARSASPTIEDFGTGKMRNGIAYVALDKTFASTISPGYFVFVTPHGDSNSLYTQPSANGFTVRESKGGRSSLTFDYRIVAKPLDAKATHLPAMSKFPELFKRATVGK